MSVQISAKGKYARRLALLGALVICSCESGFNASDGDRPRSTLSLSTLGLDNASTYYESRTNDLFETADPVEVAAESRVIRGHIGGAQDVDVYDVGPALPGDRIIAEMTVDDALDAVIALFDDSGAALLVNDHRNVYLGQKEPFVDVVIRRRTDACYVAVSATPGYRSTGDYAMLVSRQYSIPVPAPRSDVVLLIFSGGENIRIGSRGPIDVPAFDAVDIDPRYAGRTAEIIAAVVAGVRDDYAGLDVTILSTSEGTRFDGSMSRLFFGTFDPALLGVAEGIDEFNATPAQEAIVFTDTFAAFLQLDPTAAEIGQAIANVSSHEIGHLLGLVHTTDREGIMDVTASLNDLLRNQTFRESPLHSGVFPLGLQDSIQSLLDAVGGDNVLTILKYLGGDSRKEALPADPSRPPARSQFYLSSCGLDEP